MSNRRKGFFFCIILLVASIIASYLLTKTDYWHQYSDEKYIQAVTFEDIEKGNYKFKELTNNYNLNDFFFSNLTGEIMTYAPIVRYAFVDDRLYYLKQDPVSVIDDISKYILKVEPLDYVLNSNEVNNYPERIVSFVDYTYFAEIERYVYTLKSDNYTNKEIKNELSYFEKCLYSFDYESNDYGHTVYLNDKCFTDYFLIYELAYGGNYNDDNLIIYRDNNDLYSLLKESFDDSGVFSEYQYHNLISTTWFDKLIESKVFTDNVINEYHYLRKNTLSNESIFNMLDKCSQYLLDNGLYEEEVLKEKENLENYLIERLAWLDLNINSIEEYSALSATKEGRNTPY